MDEEWGDVGRMTRGERGGTLVCKITKKKKIKRLIIQVTAHAGNDVEQREHSSIVGGGTNLYSHYRNQQG